MVIVKNKLEPLLTLEEAFYDEEVPLWMKDEYHATPLSPEALVGVMLHARLSSYPHQEFTTDDAFIYLLDGEPQNFLTGNQRAEEDAVKEDTVIKILNAAPPSMHVYNGADGNFAFSAFAYAFAGRQETAYDVTMKVLKKKYAPLVTIEKANVKRRINTHHKSIIHIMETLEVHHPNLYQTLTENLSPYGYR